MINTLHLGLSYNCNMKCSHCFVNKDRDNIDIQKLFSLIDYLDNNGLFFIVYTFGEPLLAKKFWEVSNYVSKKNIVQVLMTNGSMINNETICKMQNNKIKNVYVSIDSICEHKHDLNRNYKGSFSKALNAIKKLETTGFNVGIATTINDGNVEEMKEIVGLAQTLKIRNISFLRQRVNGRIIKMKYIDKYYDFYKDYLENYKQYGINILFHDPNLLEITNKLYEANLIDDLLYEKYMDMNSCHYCSTLSVEPSGNVKHCNLIDECLGNIDNIYKILRGGIENESINSCTKLPK